MCFTVNRSMGRVGPWALLEGYIEQVPSMDDRRIFTFLRGVFVKINQVAVAVKAFESLRYPGNFEIPEPLDVHYIYAGEIPWSWRFGGELRRGNGMSRPDRREALGVGWAHLEAAYRWRCQYVGLFGTAITAN